MFTSRVEAQILQKAGIRKAINDAMNISTPKIIMACFLLAFTIDGKSLSAEKAFLTLAFFNTVSSSITRWIPRGIQMLSEAFISMKRIQQFLELEEIGTKMK